MIGVSTAERITEGKYVPLSSSPAYDASWIRQLKMSRMKQYAVPETAVKSIAVSTVFLKT